MKGIFYFWSVKMTKTKLELVYEHLVNGERDDAMEALREHFIDRAREIYTEISESDEVTEEELELDEDEELDEGYDESDASDDFEEDLETIEDEIETEEYFSEDDEEFEDEEALDDLESEMDFDVEADELDDDAIEDAADEIEDAFVSVEDSLDELRAAFAEIIGDDDEMADDEDDVADEYEAFDDEEVEESLEESAELKAVATPTGGDDDGKASPVRKNTEKDEHADVVDFAGGDEKGSSAETPKDLGVDGPQDQGGKMNKAVKKPSNKADKSKSHLS